MADVTYTLKLRDQISAVANKAQRSLNGLNSAIEKAADSLNGLEILAGGAAVAGIFNLGAELEQTRISFDTLTGSAENGKKIFDELTEFANKTPFSNEAINQSARTLLAYGQDTESVISTIKMLGDVAGGDQEKLKRLTLAFGQVTANGRLMGEELNQFIEAGFNPLKIIAQETGISMIELRNQMSKGAISADMVANAFQKATGPGGLFYGMMDKMGESMGGKWSTVMGKAKFLVAELGLSMKNLFMPVLNQLIKFIDYLSKARKNLFPLLKAVTVFISVVMSVVVALKAWIFVQKILNIVMAANPIGAIIFAVAALVAIIIVAYQESEKFRKIVDGVGRAIKALATVIFNYLIAAIQPLITALKEIWNSLNAVFKKTGETSDKLLNWADIIENVIFFSIQRILPYIQAFINIFTVIYTVVAKVSTILKSLFIGDFAGFKQALKDLGSVLWDFLVKRFQLLIKSIGYFGEAINSLLEMDMKGVAKNVFMAGKQFIFTPFGVDIEETTNKAKEAAENAMKAFNEGTAEGKIKVPGAMAGIEAGKVPEMDISKDLKELKAKGVVSGGIKTFNINISSLTGIDTLQTSNVTDGGEQMGRSIRDELLRVLADLKNIQ